MKFLSRNKMLLLRLWNQRITIKEVNDVEVGLLAQRLKLLLGVPTAHFRMLVESQLLCFQYSFPLMHR